MRPVILCYFRKMIKGSTSGQWIRQQLKMKEKNIEENKKTSKAYGSKSQTVKWGCISLSSEERAHK